MLGIKQIFMAGLKLFIPDYLINYDIKHKMGGFPLKAGKFNGRVRCSAPHSSALSW